MPHTEHFFVSSSNESLQRRTTSYREYVAGGKHEGKAKMLIEVFASHNHRLEAKKAFEALKNAGLENNFFSISIALKTK